MPETGERESRFAARIGLLLALMVVSLTNGCSRTHYRQRADAETYDILAEKTEGRPWQLPEDYSVAPDPRSRLFDPSSPVDPALPRQGPELYSYELPELESDQAGKAPAASAPVLQGGTNPVQPQPASDVGIQQAGYTQPPAGGESKVPDAARAPAPPKSSVPGRSLTRDQQLRGVPGQRGEGNLPIVPIPPEYWEPIPRACLARMLEFESVREEYRRTFGVEPDASLRDNSRKLTLENLVELAYLNSREYQTQKEVLYQTALALTLQRFDYDLKFSPFGNGTAVDYSHSRAGGTTVNTLAVPTQFQMEKMLATGGNLVARFANDVVLTFNGPEGFAADIGSELLFSVSQTVFQRDVLLNPLIQAERDVVYAARDFIRFRRTFFFSVARDYYNLLLNYRRIEIDSQNYFSLVRNLNQRESEARARIQGALSPIDIDQIEQQVLSGRSSLISTCNSLESGLDSLKITLGIPTETPINLDLTELEDLTRRDEISVAGELIQRAQRRLRSLIVARPAESESVPGEAPSTTEHRADILNASLVLIQRIQEWLRLHGLTEQQASARRSLELLEAKLHVDAARLEADLSRAEYQQVRQATPAAPPIQIFQQAMALVDSLLELAGRQADLAQVQGRDAAAVDALRQSAKRIASEAQDLEQRFSQGLLEEQLEEIETYSQRAGDLLQELEQLTQSADRLTGEPAERPGPEQEYQQTIENANQVLTTSEDLLEGTRRTLPAIALSVDQAMATALIQRLDLMNQRGFLADDWRAVKIAADELKSILDLSATQTLGTKRNRPFGFTFDESRTDLNLTFDLPLNRKAQRNTFRRALINFQAALRALSREEDNIKFDVRNDLRAIELRRVQYEISVASAALAAVRVLSTELELALGIENIRARDFLEAQDDYRAALVGVASDHTDYIVTRGQLFLDLELLLLDSNGFWPQIRDESLEPEFNQQYPPGAGPMYGEIPEFLKVSCEIEQMAHVPPPSGPLEPVGGSETAEPPVLPETTPSTAPVEPMLFAPQ